MGTVLVWSAAVLLLVGLPTRRWWRPWLARRGVNVGGVPWGWYLRGYPVVVLRMRLRWRQVCMVNGLSIAKRPGARVLGDVAVQGTALRQMPPRLGLPRPTRTGLVVRVRLIPGQTPVPFLAAVSALEHAWEVHAVRVTSPRRGEVVITVTARDALSGSKSAVLPPRPARLLCARVGTIDDGGLWEIDLRTVPHWLVIGATRSGKSTLLAALVSELAGQAVALVGIDCKGGMELGLFGPRLSVLACSRAEAVRVLGVLVGEIEARMRVCRSAGARSVWDLPEVDRPVPVVVLVDEIAELYLADGSKESREEAARCSTLLLRLAQLGAALGLHLVVAGQRVGADLGSGVTALRAQLGGRIVHRVNDAATAEMALGDLAPDAVAVAQSITETEQGVAVTTIGGRWVRARSRLVTTTQARQAALDTASLAPRLPALAGIDMVKGGEVA